MKVKQRIRLEIKEISAEGSFEGILSPYANVDGGGDVVRPGAFTKTLQEQGNTRPMLWQHKTDVPIGELTLEDRADGLWCKGQLLMALPEAQKAYLLIKAKIVKGLSIGFESVKDSIANGVRTLSEIKLYEGSVVTFPMNESALITSVKGLRETKGDFNEELTEIQLMDARYQLLQALSAAISCTIWNGDLSREEKIALMGTIWQQATDAFAAFFPLYLDCLTNMYGGMETWNAKRFETKAGRMISAANKETIKSACEQIKGGHESLLALITDEAGEDDSTTSEEKAAALKTEPVDHSALITQIDETKGALKWSL